LPSPIVTPGPTSPPPQSVSRREASVLLALTVFALLLRIPGLSRGL